MLDGMETHDGGTVKRRGPESHYPRHRNVNLSIAQDDMLRRTADELGWSVSTVLRRALERGLPALRRAARREGRHD